ncbi:expressed unknown protein [Seminavis robusta]|uniref:Uncharacterized protein n=1 Tax=Seminavis robusta TaxID=568900 RepID=A0A9N8DUY6_9STRA|nr:expressed unknown protein [Seminavis robusta]|eukprot:Sro390_g132990.1 n/a (251) ;mRNA; f:66450-67202
MISPTTTILDLNNEAVSYLCQGNHDATTTKLRAAIKSLERCFQQEKTVPSRPVTSEEPPKKKRRRMAMPKKGDYVPIRSITVTASDLPSAASSLNDETSLLMVYDRAFDFPALDSDDCMDFTSQQSKTRVASILLYNLGLSYHREGVRNGKSADLTMALKFYREAYMVLKSAWAKSDFKEVFVLLLALLNNMACIHAYMSDGKETHQCINWMNRAIASKQRAILSKEDYTFFSLNLSVFRGHQLRLASAA